VTFGWRPPPARTGQDAFERALAWRSRNLWPRGLQVSVLAALAWFATGDPLVAPWFATALALGALEQRLGARAGRSEPRPKLRWAIYSVRISSGGATAAIGVVVLAHARTPTGLAGAILVLCGVCLNNAMMSLGSRRATWTLAGPAAALLALAPLLAWFNGYRAPVADLALLSAGGVAFVIFILRLAEAMGRERAALQRALQALARQNASELRSRGEAEAGRRRWGVIFEQSPLARLVFDGSALHDRLKHTRRPGETLGQALRREIPAMADLRRFVSVLEVNQAALELCGGEFLPRPHLSESFLDAFAAALDAMSDTGFLPPFATELIRADGSRIDIEAHYRLADVGGAPWGLCLATYVDQTEPLKVAREHREAREAAERANRAKSEFLTVISHEIRTPLNGVLGMAQAMSLNELAPAQTERLDVLLQSGRSLLAIVDDLLDMSRLEKGGLALVDHPFAAADVLEAVHATYLPEARQRGLAFETIIDPSASLICRGDPARLRQILGCLVSNALKFTPTGEVEIRVWHDTEGLGFEVRDTGIGIDPARIRTLFDPFTQADSSLTRTYGGTGLGLALCRELCTAMGGSIAADRAPSGGSVFTVRLPLPVDEPIADDAALPSRVLAAEDNPVNQVVLKALLSELGITPTVVENGAEALAAWEAGDWDLVLMDIQMPEMDGLTATRLIREREAALGLARTPIVALTANAMPAQLESYFEAGVCDVVAKPIEVARLFAAIAAAAVRPPGQAQAAPQPSRRPA
jgi:signal transduction histidine kinase/ActR/RegA family two-component response regulator